ncbi:MAG: ATP-binding protein [Methanosarcinales archaeon]|nr:ATP-binding protein [Methanosarcinales archaeon]
MKGLESFDLQSHGVTARQYVLGRRNEGLNSGLLKVGRYLAIDGSTGSDVYIDCLGPHVVLICGKRGYGKSYTMGTMIEELALQEPPVSDNIASVIVDSMGIFWTLSNANTKEETSLSKWGLKPQALNIQTFVPKGSQDKYADMGIEVKGLTIAANYLSGSDWCTLFRVSSVHPLGVLITRIIQDLNEEGDGFSLDEMLDCIDSDLYADHDTKLAARNYLGAAQGWGLFEKEGLDIHEIIHPGGTSVIDLSSLSDEVIQSVIVEIIAKRIYQERIHARRQYEINKMTGSSDTTVPMVWMFVDEAHLFLPQTGSNPAGYVLVNEWLRQGRQPGLSLILATQRPSALHPDVLSQSDIMICHRLTSQDDISALESIRPTYMQRGIADSIRKMGKGKGVAFIVDDTSEASHVVQMRPRLSWHGGDEPSAMG